MKIESYFTFLLFWTLYFSILDLWADSDQYNVWRKTTIKVKVKVFFWQLFAFYFYYSESK